MYCIFIEYDSIIIITYFDILLRLEEAIVDTILPVTLAISENRSISLSSATIVPSK